MFVYADPLSEIDGSFTLSENLNPRAILLHDVYLRAGQEAWTPFAPASTVAKVSTLGLRSRRGKSYP